MKREREENCSSNAKHTVRMRRDYLKCESYQLKAPCQHEMIVIYKKKKKKICDLYSDG